MRNLSTTIEIREIYAKETIKAATVGNFDFTNTVVGEYVVSFCRDVELPRGQYIAEVAFRESPLQVIASAIVSSLDT